jgi:hypothetical protein
MVAASVWVVKAVGKGAEWATVLNHPHHTTDVWRPEQYRRGRLELTGVNSSGEYHGESVDSFQHSTWTT